MKSLLFFIALLTAAAVSYPSYRSEAAGDRQLELTAPPKHLKGELEERIDRMGGDGKYDNIVATAESEDVIAFLDPVSLGELYGAHGTAQANDFESPLMPGNTNDLSISGGMEIQDIGRGADGLMLASASDTGSIAGAAGGNLEGANDGGDGFHAYSLDTVPRKPPSESVSSVFGRLFDQGDDSAAEDLYYAGDSPFSTHSLFESVSISGTYPDSDVLEFELPAFLHPGGSQMTVGAGWLMPSGLEIPLGDETDHSMDESAYYLNVILRF